MDAQTPTPGGDTRGIRVSSADVRVKTDGDGEDTTIEVPVSGLAEDRDGDKLADSAIESMVGQINNGDGVPMFANHGFDADNGVPQAYRVEDIIGRWDTARRDGDVVIAEATLREGKQVVDELLDLFAQDMPVGFSIGFGWDEDNAEQRDSGGLRFQDVDLMEISPVGIQSHPDASTTGGLKLASALQEAGLDPETIDTDELTNAIMTAKESDEDEDDEEMDDADEGVETNQVDDETARMLRETINTHMEALTDDLMDVLEVGDEGENETDESDMDGDGDEDEDDEKAAELEAKVAELEAELEAVKTDAAGTGERKGGITPHKGDDEDGDTETNDAPTSTEREFAAGLQ